VEDVGVVGKPDDRAGETPVAFVVLTKAGNEAAERNAASVKEQIMWHVRASKVSVPRFFLLAQRLTYANKLPIVAI
jgi:acyl-CoA synthetase (AMP-forming)/AMP-acid ligase II